MTDLLEAPTPTEAEPQPLPVASHAAQRRAVWNATVFATGYHPITEAPLAEDAAPYGDADAPGSRCGTCQFFGHQQRRGRAIPKCLHPGPHLPKPGEQRPAPFASGSCRTDVDAAWPACALRWPAPEGARP